MVTYNRLEYTKKAIAALLRSQHTNFEVVVWDNASTDETRDWLASVQAADRRVSLILANSNAGVVFPMNVVWGMSDAPLLAKVDNDTLVPPNLLSRLAECHDHHPNLGVISGCHFRPEDVDGFLSSDENSGILQQSHVGGCAVMIKASIFRRHGPIPYQRRRSAGPFSDSGWTNYQNRLHQLGYMNGYPLPLPFVEHMEDTRSPYCITNEEYQQYKLSMRGMRLDEYTKKYYSGRGVSQVPQRDSVPCPSELPMSPVPDVARPEVTLFIPLAGRLDLWPQLREYLERQTWPHHALRLLFMDTSQDQAFTRQVRQWIASSDYPDVRHFCAAVGEPMLADAPRRSATIDVRVAMSQIYNRMTAEVATPFTWILEDDVMPPDDALERLLAAFDESTGSVAAPYRSRFHAGFVAWDDGQRNYTAPGQGIATVGGNGFGCAVLRTSLLQGLIFPAEDDCDRFFYRWLARTGFTAQMDWSCECQHGR